MREVVTPPVHTNDLERPILDLTRSKDPALLYRALARVLVRRELIFATSNPAQNDCSLERAVG